MIKYFCIHHSPAKERKEYLTPFFKKDNLDFNWIEDFLPSSHEVLSKEKIFNEHSANKSYLNNAEISCYLKHLKAIEIIAKSNFNGLIIEDDIEIPNFSLNEYCTKIEKDLVDNEGDILFIGSFTNHDIPLDFPNELVHEKWMRSRCAHCYLITNKTANKIHSYMSDIIAPLDWQLNYAIQKFNLKCFWSKTHINQRTEQVIIAYLLR
jgi:GR25 family glycosyltransferase involved in LPS biosynthesis